jgi:hypothetical protein
MLSHSIGSALGFILLTLLTSSVTFVVIVFGVMLRRKILLWDEQWKEKLEQEGIPLQDFADDLERTYEKIRGTFRLLGFFLVVIVALMVLVGYMGILQKPVLGTNQVVSSLWLLSLVALSAVLPAFVNFGVGTYLAETMLLKANYFAAVIAKDDFKEKKVKMQMMEKAKEIRAKRDAMRTAAAAAPDKANPAPAGK